MLNSLIEKQLLAQLDRLSDEQQQQVLNFAQFLAMKNPVGVPGKELLRFAGTIPTDDLELMEQAIMEDYEKVDLDCYWIDGKR